MQSIDQLLHDQPFFAELGESTVELLAGCAMNTHAAAGDLLFSEGQPADRFFLLRHGRVALEVHRPGTQPLVIDTADDGDVVGWSWLIPPYRWLFDARVVEPTRAVVFDAQCMRDKCDADPAVGYALLQRVTQVMYTQLQSARIRLVDVYGVPDDVVG